ncbi:DUF3106 domain-containing protein [Piscinibacter sp.]|uniref:DUF3106 domain-containing protein n=1 Tax=Piscinibacter sp. TaxID=1903157 RepID=UPI002B9DC113|nr:DUF3106 domain-containing protein [Albitalea sp.]HUG22259.1 DUF3106 domain-containing protein [Albitalea sp.]
MKAALHGLRPTRCLNRLVAGSFLVFMAALSSPAWSQPAGRPVPPAANGAEGGPRWSELTGAQRSSLKPLERQWSTIDADAKEEWLDIAGRMPRMPAAERDRVQARMTDWARLSPQQRGQARMAFQEAKEVPRQDRREQWEAYQALTPEQRRQLQSRGVPSPRERKAQGTQRGERPDEPQTKSNIVPNPAHAVPPRPVAPTVVESGPGVSTTLMSRRPSPPAHQQTGLPKIAANPGFVDKRTLLPQRGPQGAGARSAASAPTKRR